MNIETMQALTTSYRYMADVLDAELVTLKNQAAAAQPMPAVQPVQPVQPAPTTVQPAAVQPVQPVPAAVPPQVVNAAPATATLNDVHRVLGHLAQTADDSLQAQLAGMIATYGSDRVSGIDPQYYPELIARAKELAALAAATRAGG